MTSTQNTASCLHTNTACHLNLSWKLW